MQDVGHDREHGAYACAATSSRCSPRRAPATPAGRCRRRTSSRRCTSASCDTTRRDPDWPERDRFILSKGHAAPVLYAALAEAGYFPREELKTLRKLGSILQGHPDSTKTPGVEVSTGSLGNGLAIANGIALGLRLNGQRRRRACSA